MSRCCGRTPRTTRSPDTGSLRRLADAPEEDFEELLADSGSTASSYVDAAASGMSYIYRVQALNAAGLGPPGEVGAQTPPGRPVCRLRPNSRSASRAMKVRRGAMGSGSRLAQWRTLSSDWGVNWDLVKSLVHQPQEGGRVALVVHQLLHPRSFSGWTDIRCRRGRPSCARAM